MPNEWELNLEKYNINKNRYYELKAKCKQYKDWEKVILQSNATEAKKMRYSEKMIAVNKALQNALEATTITKAISKEQLHSHLLKIITGQESLIKLQTYYGVDISKNKYYLIRRMFYHELDKLVD